MTVGADYGGSHVRLAALDGRGRTIRFQKSPSPPLHRLPALIKKFLLRCRIRRPERLVVGAKGVWLPAERAALREKLTGLADQVFVLSDIELAYLAAFGTRPGILVLAGTGSIALGRDARGRFARSGGWGLKGGDPGSGLWIGTRFSKRRGNSRARAAQAARALRAAQRKDPKAAELVLEAQGRLARLALETAGKLRHGRKIPVACAGGLFENDFFRKGFYRELKKEYGGKGPKILKGVRPPLSAVKLFRPADAALRIADELKEVPHFR